MAETATASVFMSGRSQAVRIPKAFRLDAERVEIRRRGQELVLKPVEKEDQWAVQREALEAIRAEGLVFEIPETIEWEGYPRMEFGEDPEHFERRVREYEKKSDAYEQAWKAEHGQ